MVPWDWRAELCAAQASPCGLGHALSMKALHGGKATQDTIAAQKLAALLRGGLLPPTGQCLSGGHAGHP
jgi:hypothetical protein